MRKLLFCTGIKKQFRITCMFYSKIIIGDVFYLDYLLLRSRNIKYVKLTLRLYHFQKLAKKNVETGVRVPNIFILLLVLLCTSSISPN